jgi:UPF0716 protein FxsA
MVLFGVFALIAAELLALVAVAERIGVFSAVGLLIVVSLCGPWLVRRAGWRSLQRARACLAAGESPDREVLDGIVRLLAGVLVCIPGFVTDAIGLALLLPPVRALARRRISRRAARSVVFRYGGPGGRSGRWMAGRGLGDEVVDASSHRAPPDPPPGHPTRDLPPAP